MSALAAAIKAARQEVEGKEAVDYSGEALHLWSRLTDLLDTLTGEGIAEMLVTVVSDHEVQIGVMCGMNHWAYKHPEGKWFVHCGTGHPDDPGCGWDSEPHCYPTKGEAEAAGVHHQIDKAMEVLL